MTKSRLIIASVISIVLVSMLLIGSTYSIFTSQDIDENLNVYKTGDLNIKYYSNNVKITDVTPMTEEEADAVIPRRITVTNSGNVPYEFDVILLDTTSSTDNTIDYQYIMTKVGYLEPKRLSNCTNNIIKENVIVPAGKSVDIDVRIWLDSTLSNSEMGKSFYAKLKIDGQAVYNDNNEIDNDILSLNYMKTSNGNSYFNNTTYKTYIKEASFVDYIDTSNASVDATTNEKIVWDMSTTQDESVIAWLEDNGTIDENGNKYYNLYIGSKYNIYANSLVAFFYGMAKLEDIDFSNLRTSLTTLFGTTMYNGMFGECSSLTFLDLSNWNTSNVTSMAGMFWLATGVINLDVSSFNTSKVTNMSSMFQGCSSLVELGVSNFDTGKVTNMHRMFSQCHNLISLDLSSFDTSNVTNMTNMFARNNKLEELDLSSFDTRNVTAMTEMFYGCISLKKIYFNNADFSNVASLSNLELYDGMFYQVKTDVIIYVKDKIQADILKIRYSNFSNIIYN